MSDVSLRPGAPRPPARARFAAARRLKTRLQFTGWLQYLPTAAAAAAFLLVAAAAGAFGAVPLCRTALGIGGFLLAAAVFDVLTVKNGLRFGEPEPRPREDGDVFGLLRERRSCRSFQTRDLTAAHRTELLRVLAEHTRPDRLLGRAPIRTEYLAAPLTVWPTSGAHEFVVAIAPREYDRTAIVDVGRSLHRMVLHAERMGLATCWIGPGADQASVARLLGARFDPSRDHVVCVCAIGYRSRFTPLTVRVLELVQRRRKPVPELFFADPACQQPIPVDRPPFSRYRRAYEACRWAPSSFNSQTTRCVVFAGEDHVTHVDFAAATSSRYYAPVALGIWCATWEVACAALGAAGRFQVLSAEDGVPRRDVRWVAA
jgi:nitroreductase